MMIVSSTIDPPGWPRLFEFDGWHAPQLLALTGLFLMAASQSLAF